MEPEKISVLRYQDSPSGSGKGKLRSIVNTQQS
jgi:hypothetical protein